MILNREQLEKVDDRKIITVEVPEWKAKVNIKSLSVKETVEFEEAAKNEAETKDNLVTKYIALSLVDEKGERLYPDANEGMKALERFSTAAIVRLSNEIKKLGGMNEDDIEKLAKN